MKRLLLATLMLSGCSPSVERQLADTEAAIQVAEQQAAEANAKVSELESASGLDAALDKATAKLDAYEAEDAVESLRKQRGELIREVKN